MGEYQTLGALAAFLLFIGYIVGSGAGQYVDYSEVPSENITEEDLDVALSDYEELRYTYYDSSDTSVKVNVTEWENRGVLDPDIPNAQYTTGIEDIQTIVVEVNLPEDHDGGMFIGQGITIRPLTDGVNRVENLRPQDGNFRIRWEPTGSNDSTLNGTLEDVRLSTEPVETSGFVANVQSLFSITTGSTFFNEVVLGIITLVLGLILLQAVTDSLPFF